MVVLDECKDAKRAGASDADGYRKTKDMEASVSAAAAGDGNTTHGAAVGTSISHNAKALTDDNKAEALNDAAGKSPSARSPSRALRPPSSAPSPASDRNDTMAKSGDGFALEELANKFLHMFRHGTRSFALEEVVECLQAPANHIKDVISILEGANVLEDCSTTEHFKVYRWIAPVDNAHSQQEEYRFLDSCMASLQDSKQRWTAFLSQSPLSYITPEQLAVLVEREQCHCLAIHVPSPQHNCPQVVRRRNAISVSLVQKHRGRQFRQIPHGYLLESLADGSTYVQPIASLPCALAERTPTQVDLAHPVVRQAVATTNKSKKGSSASAAAVATAAVAAAFSPSSNVEEDDSLVLHEETRKRKLAAKERTSHETTTSTVAAPVEARPQKKDCSNATLDSSKSLSALAREFTKLSRNSFISTVDVEEAASHLNAPIDRLRDVIDILEGASVLKKVPGKNKSWKWLAASYIMPSLGKVKMEEESLNFWIKWLQRVADDDEPPVLSAQEGLVDCFGRDSTLLIVTNSHWDSAAQIKRVGSEQKLLVSSSLLATPYDSRNASLLPRAYVMETSSGTITPISLTPSIYAGYDYGKENEPHRFSSVRSTLKHQSTARSATDGDAISTHSWNALQHHYNGDASSAAAAAEVAAWPQSHSPLSHSHYPRTHGSTTEALINALLASSDEDPALFPTHHE